MPDEKYISLERELHKLSISALRISALEEKVKNLTKKVSKLEGGEDDFEVRNCVRLRDKNDDRMLEVTRVTSKSFWIGHGDKNPFLKREYKVKKIE